MPSAGGHRIIEDAVESPTTFKKLLVGCLGLLGIAWLLLSVFVLGFVVLRAGAAAGINASSAVVVAVAGLITWVCGVVLIGLYVMALVKRQAAPAILVILTPLIGASVPYVGPTAHSGDWLGAVPTVGVAVLAAGLVLVATAFAALLVTALPRADDAPGAERAKLRTAAALAAMVVGAVGVVLTLWMVLWGTFWGGFAETPSFAVSWGFVLAPVWLYTYWLWRKAGRTTAHRG